MFVYKKLSNEAMNVFDFADYKQFLRAQIAANRGTRGYQSFMARAAKCQGSYLSSVLNSSRELSPDQALGIGTALGLPSDELDWFLELVHLARAASEPLRKRILERLKVMKKAREDLAHKFKRPRLPNSEREAIYYAGWYWSALHIITSIPRYCHTKEIAERLNLAPSFVNECLGKLETMGLVKSRGQEWTIVPGGLHLPKDSGLAGSHHVNWRQKAVMDSFQPGHDGLHFTDVHSLSVKDFEKVRDCLLELLDRIRPQIKSSPSEELACLCLDYFRV